MSTFNVTLKREVVTIERKEVQIEADNMPQARVLAQGLAETDGQDPSTLGGWKETDATEAEIGLVKVEHVTLHAVEEHVPAE